MKLTLKNLTTGKNWPTSDINTEGCYFFRENDKLYDLWFDEYERVEKETKGFTVENPKFDVAMGRLYDVLKEKNPQVLKNVKVEEKVKEVKEEKKKVIKPQEGSNVDKKGLSIFGGLAVLLFLL